VTVGDSEYTEAGGRVADLVVETTVDGTDRVSFTLQYPFDEERGTFRGLSWESITAGTAVSVAMGYGDGGSLTPLFQGRIDSVRATFDRSVGPTVTVEGFGRLRATMTGTESRSWRETDLATVVESVLDPYSFATLDVAASVERAWLFQDNRSDYRFLAALAETYGFQFYASRDTVVFRPREEFERPSDTVADLWYGDTLREFEGEVRCEGETTAVEVRSWDPDRGEERVATAGPADADTTDVYRAPAMTRQETETIATERHSSLTDGCVEGHGVADGTPALRAGVTVRLSELGERFSGTYRVTEATHRMGESGYRTAFEAQEVTA
jgi:phage protein D